MENQLVNITRKEFPLYSEQILEIENSSFPSPWSINAFEGEIERPVSHLWALIDDKNLVAYCCFWMFDSEIQVINLAVHPIKRGQRLGQSLLSSIIETGLSKGLKHIWLEVRPSNVAARGLYDKLGFNEIGRRPRYYSETNEDAIIMALDLACQGNRNGLDNTLIWYNYPEEAVEFIQHLKRVKRLRYYMFY